MAVGKGKGTWTRGHCEGLASAAPVVRAVLGTISVYKIPVKLWVTRHITSRQKCLRQDLQNRTEPDRVYVLPFKHA